jgi:hypothetical protein
MNDSIRKDINDEIQKIKDNCKKKEKMRQKVEVAIASLMNCGVSFCEEEPRIVVNGYIIFYNAPRTRTYLHGNWAIEHHGCYIEMMDVKSVEFIPGHGV